MEKPVFYQAGSTEAICRCAALLKEEGISFAERPFREVTDLLLDVPSFASPGVLRSGMDLSSLLEKLGRPLRIWGGKLPRAPSFIDLLEDPGYCRENAAITADCALRLCGLQLKTTWKGSQVLIIGWGRIGKKLSAYLKALECPVTLCIRKENDRALARSLGYQVISPEQLPGSCYQVIFNTAPDLSLPEEKLGGCPIPVDLSSRNGLLGSRVIHARGLPGIYAPEASGSLIAATILRRIRR